MTDDAPVGACRSCGLPIHHLVVDLGVQPLANSYLSAEQLLGPEPKFPLRVFVCEECWLVQLQDFTDREEIFNDDYAYFSSYSSSWLAHAAAYADRMVGELHLGANDLVLEIASNDGYLLRGFVAHGVGVLGIEPSGSVAAEARRLGIPTEEVFFGRDTARRLLAEGRRPSLVVGNNVFAHVPDLDDFVGGLSLLVETGGIITLEFPHLLRLVNECQFDTIYHEHFSYFALGVVRSLFERYDLTVFDVEELPTHGGSLRVFAAHRSQEHDVSPRVDTLIARERDEGLFELQTYAEFARRVVNVKEGLLTFLESARSNGRSVAGYGAPAKGNTLLNYCGVGPELVQFTVDMSPHKQHLFLPGSHLPIAAPDDLFAARPDYVLLLPWNLRDEIVTQMQDVRTWGGKFVVAVPQLSVS